MHSEPLSYPTVKRLPPLETLVALKALITAIPSSTSLRLTARRNSVCALAFDKLALTNANAEAIVACFPFHNKSDRYSLLHAIVSSTPPPTLPGLDPDFALEHLIDQHLLVLYLLGLSLMCTNSAAFSDTDIVTAKHPVLEQYCSATLLPTHYIYQALACVFLDLDLPVHFDAVFPFARMQANPVLFEFIVWVLAFDAEFLHAHDGSLIPCFKLAATRQDRAGDQEDKVARARSILVLCYARGDLPPELTMSVCLTWNVNDAVKAAINDPVNLVPLLSYISANYSAESTATRHHLTLLTNNAHFLLAPSNGTKLRNDLISWSLCHVLAPPDNDLAHIPNLVFHLFSNAIDYPRAVYTHYRIKQIKKHNNVGESRADMDRETLVKTVLLIKMQVTHVAELKVYMAQGVPGERVWLTQEGLEDLLFTNAKVQDSTAAGFGGLKLAPSVKRPAPVAEWAKASTLVLDHDKKPMPLRLSSSGASDATVALPEALLLGGSVGTGDLIREAPLESPERPAKMSRKNAPTSPIRQSIEKEDVEQAQADREEGDSMDVDAGQESFVYSDQVMELQTSQSPIRSSFLFATTPSVAPTLARPMPTAEVFTPTPSSSTMTSGDLTGSQMVTPASTSSSPRRDPFTPSFALARTPSSASNHPSTTPPSVATHSILHVTPKRDGTPRTPRYLALTPVDAAKAIMSRRSRRSNPASSAAGLPVQQASNRSGSPSSQSPAHCSRLSAASTGRTVTPFKSRLSNSAQAGGGESTARLKLLTTDDVIMATFVDNQQHQEMIAAASSNATRDAETSTWSDTPPLPTTNMDIDQRPTTPEPAPAPTSAPATPFDSDPTIRPFAHLPKFDYAQFHKSLVHESPATDTQTLIESGKSAVERAQAMVRKSQAAANARAANQMAEGPETPIASRERTLAVTAGATPSTPEIFDSMTATPTVRPGRMPDVSQVAMSKTPAVAGETPEKKLRRVRDAGHTPAPARPAKTLNARTPYDTQQTPRRATRAAAAAAVVASPRYELRHNKPVAAAVTAAVAMPVSPAQAPPARRATRRVGSASQVDASPAKTPKRAAPAAPAADTTPKAVPARGTRAGLRSAASLGVEGPQAAPGSPSRSGTGATIAAASGRVTRRATMGGAGAAGADAAGTGTGTAGSRRATSGQQQQQKHESAAQGVAPGLRPRRAATAGKKK